MQCLCPLSELSSRGKGITHKTWLGWVLASRICAPTFYSTIQQLGIPKLQAERLGTRRCAGDNKAQLLPRHLRAMRRACTSLSPRTKYVSGPKGWAGGPPVEAERSFRQAAISRYYQPRTMRPRSIGSGSNQSVQRCMPTSLYCPAMDTAAIAMLFFLRSIDSCQYR